MKGKDLVQWWKNKLDNYEPIPSEEVHTGPVMESVQKGEEVDLLRFPAVIWHQHDGARYLATGSASVSEIPTPAS